MSLIATLDVALRGSTADLDNKLGQSQKLIKGFADGVADAGKRIDVALAAVTGGMSKVAGFGTYFSDALSNAWEKLKGMAAEGAEGIAALAKSADRLGMTTQRLGGLEHAAALVGVPFDELVGMLGKFQRHLGDAANAGGPIVATLQQLGIPLEALKDKNLYDAFLLVTDGFRKFGNEADKTRIATELFSKTGINMKPVLMLGSDAIREMTEEAMRLGIAVGSDQAAAVRAARRALREYDEALKGIGRSLAIVVAPLLESTNKAWARIAATVANFMRENVPLFGAFVEAIIGIKNAAIEMAGVLATKVAGAVGGMFAQLSGGGDWETTLLKGFWTVQFAAENWRRVMDLALDGVQLGFLVLSRNVQRAMKEIELSVVTSLNELQKQLNISDNELVQLGKTFASFFDMLMRMGSLVITAGRSEIVRYWAGVKAAGEAVANQIGHPETPRERQLKQDIGNLGLESGAEFNLKNRLARGLNKLSDDMGEAVERKMEGFNLQFRTPDIFDQIKGKLGWLGRPGMPGMDPNPEVGKALQSPESMKVGALERGSAAAFSVIYGQQSAQDKALATANKTLEKNEAMRKLLEKLERNMRDPVVLRRARL